MILKNKEMQSRSERPIGLIRASTKNKQLGTQREVDYSLKGQHSLASSRKLCNAERRKYCHTRMCPEVVLRIQS